MLESFVTIELLGQCSWTNNRFDLFHYRESDGPEVDLVLELDDGAVLAIEVKSAASISAQQFKGLRHLRDRLGDRFIAGIVLNTGATGYRYADRLYGAPVAALWARSRCSHRAGKRLSPCGVTAGGSPGRVDGRWAISAIGENR